MKIIKLLLISLIVLSCSKDDDEPDLITAKEYGVYVINKNLETEYSYRFYNFHTGETFHEGVTNNNHVYFNVTAKELESNYLLVDVKFENPNDVTVYVIVKNSEGGYLNIEDSPDATTIFELNPVNFYNGYFSEGILWFDDNLYRWLYNFSNN